MTGSAPITVAPAKAASREGLWRVYRRLFSDRPERSRKLRLLTLAASAWAALTLAYVTNSPWPLAFLPGFALAHLVSYRNLRKRVPLLSVGIAAVIITAGVAMRFDLVLAISGDRVPVAYFMLISAVAAGFEIRTRSGLYTQLVFSGLVMFFAGELAFGNEFGLFLTAYLLFVVAFLSMAHITDQREDAATVGFDSPPAAAGYWSLVIIGVALAALAAFLLLPWDASQTPQAAQSSVLPFNGDDAGATPGVTHDGARSVMDGAAGVGAAASGPGGGATTGAIAGVDPNTVGPVPDEEGPATGSALATGVVARVRSPVASYWRAETLDRYLPTEDGAGVWTSTIADQRQRGFFSGGRGDEAADDARYLQTVFVEQTLRRPIAGYDPVAWALPLDDFGRPVLEPGSKYQAVSTQPDLSALALRSDASEWVRSEYSALPDASERLTALTTAVTAGAATDFDRAAAIAAYLHGLKYDEKSTSPLTSSAPLEQFITGEAPGSAIDFATAAALMARAASLQSRVATGYLPGKFSPYSGASSVTAQDAHAWAEIRFRDAGWVPFDASTRLDLPTPTSLTKPPPRGLSTLIEHRVGDSLASAARNTPGSIASAVKKLISSWPVALASLAITLAGAGGAWWAWARSKRGGRRRRDFQYRMLQGKDRQQVLRAFAAVERSLARSGFRRRRPAEDYTAYAAAAAATGSAESINKAGSAASRAAYSTVPISRATLSDVLESLQALRRRKARQVA